MLKKTLALCCLSFITLNVFANISSYTIKGLPLPNGQPTTIPLTTNTAIILKTCLPKIPAATCNHHYCTVSKKEFAQYCVTPYINGLWLDTKGLYRSNNMLLQEATDKLIQSNGAYPVFYPATTSQLTTFIRQRLIKEKGTNKKLS